MANFTYKNGKKSKKSNKAEKHTNYISNHHIDIDV